MDKEKLIEDQIAMVENIYSTTDYIDIAMVSAKLKHLLDEKMEEVLVEKKAQEENNMIQMIVN